MNAFSLFTVLVLAALSPLDAGAQELLPDLDAFLRQHIGFTADELAGLQQGKFIGRILPSSKDEVAVFGILMVHAPADFYVERFRDIATFKKGASVPAVGKFGDPPRIEDLAELTVDHQDFDAARRCEVGNCDIKLPSSVIERLKTEIDWHASDAPEQLNRLARAALLDYVKRYLAGGNAELSEYADKKKPLRIAEEFAAILQASPYIYDYSPEFYQYLRDFPRQTLNGVENFIYWSKENFGLKPVISATHVSIFHPHPGVTFIASKQIYGSHYFEASLGLTVVREVKDAPTPSFYLLYFNRSRSDALHGMFSGLIRGQVRGRTLNGAKENMQKVRNSIEAEFQKANAKP